MRHKFPVLTMKKWLKSVYIYGSYRKNKIGVPLFGPPCRGGVGKNGVLEHKSGNISETRKDTEKVSMGGL